MIRPITVRLQTICGVLSVIFCLTTSPRPQNGSYGHRGTQAVLGSVRFLPVLRGVFEAFGPDWPVCLVAAEYTQVIDLLQNYMTKIGLPTTQQNQVIDQIAAGFYGIKK
jgi:hypothetical protein